MPSAHTRKPSGPGYFHVFNRASDGRPLFIDDEDRLVFEEIQNRHLSRVPHFDARGRQYVCLRDSVRMVGRNILTTHFHNIFRQIQAGGMEDLMRRVTNAYTRYFHQRHGTDGTLFDDRYRARRIEDLESLRWRIAYVQGGQSGGVDHRFSTHRRYLDEPEDWPSWLEVGEGLRIFGGLDKYKTFLQKRQARENLDAELRGSNRWRR